MLKEYLSELLSIQCEQAYGTAQRLKDTGALSDEDRAFLVKAQDALISVRDRFRVVVQEGEGPEHGLGRGMQWEVLT